MDVVMAAASRIIAIEGEKSLTMDRLAEESGVSRASLYRRFGGRKEIIKQLVAEDGSQISRLVLETDIRQRILAAAQSVMSSIGSLDFTMEQVADKAGLGVATLYRHFGNRDALLQQMAEKFHPRQAALDLLEHDSGDIRVDLERFTTQVMEFMVSQMGVSRLIFSGDARIRQLLQSNQAHQERTLTTLTRYLTIQVKNGTIQEADPFNLATLFFGMIMGFAFLKPAYGSMVEDPNEIASLIVNVFLDGVQKGQV